MSNIGEEPILEAPHLAEVHKRLFARPAWRADKPLAVELDLWHQAKGELKAALEARGWPLNQDRQLTNLGIENFLLCGIPVVIDDDAHQA